MLFLESSLIGRRNLPMYAKQKVNQCSRFLPSMAIQWWWPCRLFPSSIGFFKNPRRIFTDDNELGEERRHLLLPPIWSSRKIKHFRFDPCVVPLLPQTYRVVMAIIEMSNEHFPGHACYQTTVLWTEHIPTTEKHGVSSRGIFFAFCSPADAISVRIYRWLVGGAWVGSHKLCLQGQVGILFSLLLFPPSLFGVPCGMIQCGGCGQNSFFPLSGIWELPHRERRGCIFQFFKCVSFLLSLLAHSFCIYDGNGDRI